MKRILQATVISALLFGAYAHALPISPGGADLDSTVCGFTEGKNGKSKSNCGPGTKEIYDFLDNYEKIDFDSSDLLYKSEEDGDDTGTDEGPFANLYTTKFSNSIGDPSDALISWNGGMYLSEAEWLLVKDGGGTPIWYLFDLVRLGWDGMEELVLSGFWPEQGAISHVSIFGPPTTVPEPGTLALLGIGLLGVAFLRRKKAAA